MSLYQLLSVAEAAEELRRNRWFVYKELRRKRLAFHRIGGGIAISRQDLDE
jgi:excisionase family DNA binding protein